MSRPVAGLAVLAVAIAGCVTPVLGPRSVAGLAARRELRCRLASVERLGGSSFRASSACGETLYLRCSGTLHVDCHSHSTERDVTGFFHPGDAPGHSPL